MQVFSETSSLEKRGAEYCRNKNSNKEVMRIIVSTQISRDENIFLR